MTAKSKFGSRQFNKIISLVIGGYSVRSACEELGLDRNQYNRYIKATPADMIIHKEALKYTALAAMDDVYDASMEAMHLIEQWPPAAILQHLRWLASKYNPEMFGDQVQTVNHTVSFYDRMREELANTSPEELEADLPKALINQMLSD